MAVVSTKLSQADVEQTWNVRTSPTAGGTVAEGVTRPWSKRASDGLRERARSRARSMVWKALARSGGRNADSRGDEARRAAATREDPVIM